MDSCVHPLDWRDFKAQAHYCGCTLCVLCRRRRAIAERRILKHQLDTAKASMGCPAFGLFLTLTLRDAAPAEIKPRADTLVKGFEKLRRKLKPLLGWARVIEVKSAFNPALDNVHLHTLLLFPIGSEDEMRQMDWPELWGRCAGASARDACPEVAYDASGAACYMTKSLDSDFLEDAEIGIANPERYVLRVRHGHTKFSSGGKLKMPVFSEEDRMFGFDAVIPRSTARSQQRQLLPGSVPEIPIEGE